MGTILIYCSSIAAQVSVSQYMAFTSAFGMLLGAFGQLGSAAGTIAQIRPQLENARPIFEKVPETASATTVISHSTGSIELTEVSFAYEGSSRPASPTTSAPFPWGCMPSSRRVARASRVDSDNALPSRVLLSPSRASSCSTRPQARSTTRRNE